MSNTIFADDKLKELYIRADERTAEFYTQIREKKFSNLGLKYRNGQRIISLNFINSLIDNKILIKEAGVGVGKSFSYLIPTLYLIDEFMSSNKDLGPVIISTSSISLQNQLMRDITFLKNIMGLEHEITANVALGMNNYVCLKRIDDILEEGKIFPKEDRFFRKLAKEMIANNTSLMSSINHTIKPYFDSKIRAVSRIECNRCNYGKCQVPSELRKLKDSNIIIVNHQLLARYAMDNDELLTNSNTVIIDEGHNLEDAIRTVMSEDISIESLFDIIKKAGLDNDFSIVKDLNEKFKELFKVIKYQAENSNKNYGVLDKYSYYDNLPIDLTNQNIRNITIDLLKSMKIFREYLNKNNLLKLKDIRKFDEHIDFIGSLIRGNSYIFSVETYEKKGSNNGVVFKDKWIKIRRTPKNLIPVVKKIFNDKGVMITSATIPENIISDLGIQGPVDFSNPVPSPFDYNKNAIYYDYSDGLMEPRIGHTKNNYQKYTDDLAYRIASSIVASNGRSLVLFTNKNDANSVFKKVNILLEDAKTRNPNINIPLLLQSDKNKDTIAVEFKDNNKSVLFSYGFWEGLDVPGDSLSQVIVTRLPFPVMTPNLSYKSENCSNVDEAMNEYYIPEMISKLRQSFGRLIRTVDDKGAIINLDSRSKTYSNAIDYALNKSCPGIKIANNLKEVDAMFNKIDNVTSNTPRIRTLKK